MAPRCRRHTHSFIPLQVDIDITVYWHCFNEISSHAFWKVCYSQQQAHGNKNSTTNVHPMPRISSNACSCTVWTLAMFSSEVALISTRLGAPHTRPTLPWVRNDFLLILETDIDARDEELSIHRHSLSVFSVWCLLAECDTLECVPLRSSKPAHQTRRSPEV